MTHSELKMFNKITAAQLHLKKEMKRQIELENRKLELEIKSKNLKIKFEIKNSQYQFVKSMLFNKDIIDRLRSEGIIVNNKHIRAKVDN